MNKHLIFLGGEAGVGKSVSAKEVQKSLSSSIIIDKDESTSVLVNALLSSYGLSESDRESDMYLSKVKPLEYKQLDNIVWDGIKNTSMIITAPYFDSFLGEEWINTMKDLGNFHKAHVSFIFLTGCPNKIQSGLIERAENRDKWKLENYNLYRKGTDSIIEKILKNKAITHIDYRDMIEPELITLELKSKENK